jgi:hypothetical protein
MTRNERKMVSQLLALCEKQYRKGVQHGAYEAVQNKTTKAADTFRAAGSYMNYKRHDWFNWSNKKEEGAKEFAARLAWECPSGDELRGLLFEFSETLGDKQIKEAYDIEAHGKQFEPSR